jgi:V-type H+-transporting ATPase subunit E
MNDNEVAQEMNKMVRSINRGCFHQAGSLRKSSGDQNQGIVRSSKADEEFNIEKGKLVRAETAQIEAFFQKKLKQAEVQRKM